MKYQLFRKFSELHGDLNNVVELDRQIGRFLQLLEHDAELVDEFESYDLARATFDEIDESECGLFLVNESNHVAYAVAAFIYEVDEDGNFGDLLDLTDLSYRIHE